MESRRAEVPFNAGWNSLLSVASMPVKFFSTFPYEVRVDGRDKPTVRISFGRFFTRFSFEGNLEFTFNEPHVTYILKGMDGLLVLSFAALDSRLVTRVSADIPSERRLGRKLKFLAEGSVFAAARMAESYKAVAGKVVGPFDNSIVESLNSALLPHLIRYVRLHTGRKSFRLKGVGERDRFTVTIVDDFIKRMEHDSGSGVSIIEVERGTIDVTEEDFGGVELRGRYRVKVL